MRGCDGQRDGVWAAVRSGWGHCPSSAWRREGREVTAVTNNPRGVIKMRVRLFSEIH